jgi:Transglycosylase SLT domain
MATGLLLTTFGLGWFAGGSADTYFDNGDELATGAAVDAIVEKIISVESNGDPNAKSKRSSALGLGQFLDETWLDLIRIYRPDLTRGRSEIESLELRREPSLAREITTRLVERNAAMLRRRGLPVTPGTVYLAHFAGVAGAVAVLSAPEEADAASVMATSDATGRTKREQLVKANRFLEHFTIADLKAWADRKTQSPGL